MRNTNADATALRINFARYLAPHYLDDPLHVASLCDEYLDRSGGLLGHVRREAERLREHR